MANNNHTTHKSTNRPAQTTIEARRPVHVTPQGDRRGLIVLPNGEIVRREGDRLVRW